MEFLSLEEPEPQRGRGLTRAEAQGLSVALHLLAALLFLYLPERLPEGLRAFFRPRAPRAAAASIATAPQPTPRPRTENIPLRFEYVRVPNDTTVKENPRARILSNRNRAARQETPTPRDALRLTDDPHSAGNTMVKVRPDPSRPEGPESLDPVSRQGALVKSAALPPNDTEGGPGREGGDGGDAGGAQGHQPGELAGAGPARAPGLPGGAGQLRQQVREMLAEVKAGEIKDTFHNPGYLREGALGMLSFDTKDFPWGDYRQHVYVKVLNNWLDRIPLAARQGMRGWLCLRFVIEKDGRVSEIRILRPSSVPPFDRAAEDALRASSAFAPLPDGFPGEREGITGCFIYNLLPDEIERF